MKESVGTLLCHSDRLVEKQTDYGEKPQHSDEDRNKHPGVDPRLV